MSNSQPPFDLDDLDRNYRANRQPTAEESNNKCVIDPDDYVRQWLNTKPSIFGEK